MAVVASSGVQQSRVVVFDLADPLSGGSVRRRGGGETVPPAALSAPQPVSWESFDGELAHGLYYPPASERFEGTGAPPLIVLVHGGPTSQVNAGWNGNVSTSRRAATRCCSRTTAAAPATGATTC